MVRKFKYIKSFLEIWILGGGEVDKNIKRKNLNYIKEKLLNSFFFFILCGLFKNNIYLRIG